MNDYRKFCKNVVGVNCRAERPTQMDQMGNYFQNGEKGAIFFSQMGENGELKKTIYVIEKRRVNLVPLYKIV